METYSLDCMPSYLVLKYFLFNLEALDVLSTVIRGQCVIDSASPFQQRLTVSILADWVRQRAVRPYLKPTLWLGVFSISPFPRSSFYRWYGILTQMLNQFLTYSPLMSNGRLPVLDHCLAILHIHIIEVRHVCLSLRRSSITPLVAPQYTQKKACADSFMDSDHSVNPANPSKSA